MIKQEMMTRLGGEFGLQQALRDGTAVIQTEGGILFHIVLICVQNESVDITQPFLNEHFLL